MKAGLPRSVVLAGAGKMGGALLRGWLDQGLPPGGVAVLDPRPSDELRSLSERHGFSLNDVPPALRDPEVFVLAVKPQMMADAATTFGPLRLEGSVLVSVVAGKTIANLSAQLPTRAIVRAMPNTPAGIGRGITGAFANPAVTAAQRAMSHALMAAVGQVEWLDSEDQIDAVTAVSGSGPAYVFLLTECLAEAAGALGLDPALAGRLARATVEGAGALMASEPGVPAADLRRNVTSPAGTTAAALDVFGRDEALKALVIRAVAAARDRAAALAG